VSLAAGAVVLVAVLLTATLSGVLGMAGGLLLMGVLLLVLPTAVAFVVHGLLQLVSNGWRTVLHRRHVHWRVLAWYAVGSVTAAGLVGALAWVPSKPVTYLALGLVPGLVWLPRRWLALDITRPPQAVVAGLLSTGVNLVAGVSGPLLDVFFVRAELGRHAVVATKAATQALAHLAKIVVYGAVLTGDGQAVPWLVVLLGVPLSVLGTALGGRLLDRMTEAAFTSTTRWVVTAIGAVYLLQAARLAL
jgi:uncharacterized membrane protein YfcA